MMLAGSGKLPKYAETILKKKNHIIDIGKLR